MRITQTVVVLAALALVAACSGTAPIGPNGGDVVAIKDGTVYAEIVSNPETGEVIVQTYDEDLATPRPIEHETIVVGTAGKTVELMPYPTIADGAGRSSRFYGQADWMRGGLARQGWMEGRSLGERREFEWKRSGDAGRARASMWEQMGPHRRMGQEHGDARPMDR